MHCKLNEQLFPKKVGHSATLIENSSDIYFYLFSKKNLTGSIMGSKYLGVHIAGDHIHMDIITCNTKEPQQKYRFGTHYQ